MIRGHKWVDGGIAEEFKDRCYTVHTSAMLEIPFAPSFIVLRSEEINSYEKIMVDLSKNAMHSFSADYSDGIWTEILSNFLLRAYVKNPVTYLESFDHEKILKYLMAALPCEIHHLSHLHLAKWILSFAAEIFKTAKVFHPVLRDFLSPEVFPRLFPVIYDILYGKGCTFRIGVPYVEKEIIKKVHLAFEKMDD